MKKLLLTLGTTAATVAPLATVVACGAAPDFGTYAPGDPAIVTYHPDLDMALALGIEVTSTHHNEGSDKVIKMIEESGQFDQEILDAIGENNPLWDFGDFDQEYWLSLEPSLLMVEHWVGAQRRDEINDLVPNTAFFDYNTGVQGETYEIAIVDSAGEKTNTWRIANDSDTIYGDPTDYWQMQDMSAFTMQAAEALDAQSGVSGTVSQAEKVIERTDERWEAIRKIVLNDDAATLPTGDTWTAVTENNKGDIENLLAFSISATDSLEPTISTPSHLKELYTKSGYNYPEITETQAAALAAKGGNWVGLAESPAKRADTSQTDNGISFNVTGQPEFYGDYDGKIDKMIIALPDATREANTKEELFAQIQNNAVIGNFLETGSTIDDVMFVSPWLVGSNAHNFKQPIGQNTIIDAIGSEWLNIEEENDFFTWW